MKGTVATSGSLVQSLQVARHGSRRHRSCPRPCACRDIPPFLDCCRPADRFFVFAFLDEPGELRRTGHVGPSPINDEDAALLVKGCYPERRSGFVSAPAFLPFSLRSRRDLDLARFRGGGLRRLRDGLDVLMCIAVSNHRQ